MANVARAPETPVGFDDRQPLETGSAGSVLMGSAIGIVAAIGFGVFLWLAVH